MDDSQRTFSDVLALLKYWIPWRSEPANVSRDFWMPDQSCRVCYECDSQFTLFNRRHHCRLCGRIFCANCTSNWIPAEHSEPKTPVEEWERLRVCNYCFKHWEHGLTVADNGIQVITGLDVSIASPSATSFLSTRSGETCGSSSITFASLSQSAGLNPHQSAVIDTTMEMQNAATATTVDNTVNVREPNQSQSESVVCQNRSDDGDEEFGKSRPSSRTSHFSQFNGYYDRAPFSDIDSDYKAHTSFDSINPEDIRQMVKSGVEQDIGEECETPSSLYVAEDVDAQPMDFENNGFLWIPPEPEDEEDERDTLLFDDDDYGDAAGEWGYFRKSSSFGSGESRSREKSNEEHKRAMKSLVGGHFRALIAQLLQVENLFTEDENDKESWLEIVTALSWEAATLVKPDTSKGSQMDPGGYVKVKCVASGLRSESSVVRGIVCKKNVAHRRMASKIEKPSLLILGGALEYQRVSNALSSFDTLLQQEMDHLKMAVAKIDAQNPNILLVEKSVSRYAQEYLLAKDISLVLNIKRPLLERISRCTGAQIVPSVDNLSSHKLGYCDMLHVEKVLEEHGSADQAGKKLVKTLMYFEGCPKPLGCTILLRGANGDELKRVKHVVQYGIFAAYHLALETSFLADEGAYLPEFSFDSPITMALSEKSSATDSSTSIIPGRSISDPSSLQFEGKQINEEHIALKEGFSSSTSDHKSILVSLSSRCVRKGTVCERSHLFRIKYYGSFDKPLGRYLRDQLFDQSNVCRSCEMSAEAHIQCYTHRQGTLTISVKELVEGPLPGEKDGKIWMWHRCLKCPRIDGFPPPTRRVVMSNAAWGLSFGKFLELSFSNHAAASRVASCGHSLHRDCIRFYGYGKMVACFRYASIAVHSVYLPPSQLGFNFDKHEWLERELNEVVGRVELLFSEVLNALRLLIERKYASGLQRRQIADLETMLQREKLEFEESLQKILDNEAKKSQPVIDILELNRLRRQLVFQSYIWDQRLIHTSSLFDKNQPGDLLAKPEPIKSVGAEINDVNTQVKTNKILDSSEPIAIDVDPEKDNIYGARDNLKDNIDAVQQKTEVFRNPGNQNLISIHHGIKASDKPDPWVSRVTVRRALSDGQAPICLSDTLDAAWTGENHPGSGGMPKNKSFSSSVEVVIPPTVSSELNVEDLKEELSVFKVPQSPFMISTKSLDNVEENVSWLSMPFMSFYRSLNKNLLGSAQKFDTLSYYDPVYISSFRDSEVQGEARLLLAMGVNDTVIPVYDDEPTSIIAYALVSPDYFVQLSDEDDRPKDNNNTESVFSMMLPLEGVASQSFLSLDETILESSRNLGSGDESVLLSTSSRSSLPLDPVSYTTAMHARVSFIDGPQGKVKYSVTCYYAKRFEALRRICCPSEIDFIRSISRCKKWGAQGGKSNVFFAKTLDDRFIIKQVTKTELESFIKFAPNYFKYLSESIDSGSPTCLAKILGIYQVTSKHLKGGKETKMDVLIMENLLFGRNLTRLYDLKGSSRSRYNADSSGSNKVLLDENLIEAMPTSPIFVGNKAKRLLERAVWNDTAFLDSIDVMDYSLLVGVDEERQELVLGIIDFMRQYTWDKHLETWVKASGILGGAKNAPPTVISPNQYKKRFRKAMTTYFLMVPDQWSPPTIVPPSYN